MGLSFFQKGPLVMFQPSDLAKPIAYSAKYCSIMGPLLEVIKHILGIGDWMQNHTGRKLSQFQPHQNSKHPNSLPTYII